MAKGIIPRVLASVLSEKNPRQTITPVHKGVRPKSLLWRPSKGGYAAMDFTPPCLHRTKNNPVVGLRLGRWVPW